MHSTIGNGIRQLLLGVNLPSVSNMIYTDMLESLGDCLISVLNKGYFWVLRIAYSKILDLFLLVNQSYILEDHIE